MGYRIYVEQIGEKMQGYCGTTSFVDEQLEIFTEGLGEIYVDESTYDIQEYKNRVRQLEYQGVMFVEDESYYN